LKKAKVRLNRHSQAYIEKEEQSGDKRERERQKLSRIVVQLCYPAMQEGEIQVLSTFSVFHRLCELGKIICTFCQERITKEPMEVSCNSLL
jgi:hypothetical protein